MKPGYLQDVIVPPERIAQRNLLNETRLRIWPPRLPGGILSLHARREKGFGIGPSNGHYQDQR